MRVLGIMSGTSLDGVDYALCTVREDSVRLLKVWSRPFPKALRLRLHAAATDRCSAHELAQLHHDLGRLYARQAASLQSRAALIGLHGQTVFHHPDRRAPATLQIGEPAYLAEFLRVPVVSNFRAGDLAAGGQGAPLATLFHQLAFARRGAHVCVHNLGGISNVTSLDWRSGRSPTVLAFDTGPANVLLDLAVRSYTHGSQSRDWNGRWARQGTVCEELLGRWLAHPYFHRRPPKSTGRELFGELFWRAEWSRPRLRRLHRHDVLATLAEFTARSIDRSYRDHLPGPPDQVILCGGGARNPWLTERIEVLLRTAHGETRLTPSFRVGWPETAIEAAAFACLAHRRWHRRAGNLPSTTGARRAAILGQVTLP